MSHDQSKPKMKQSIVKRLRDILISTIKTIWGSDAMETAAEVLETPADVSETPLEQTEILYRRLRSVPGLWGDLYEAAGEGKPACLRKIKKIAAKANMLSPNPDDAPQPEKTFKLYSEHHESISLMELSSEDHNTLSTIVWALEGETIKE